ncbi:glycosyl hydrolase family 76-domain-containing protein [Poronia punctata]|nr:glycosyl hydrolase family 76-domain-containing protein [Poronia punctata]
MYKFLPCLLFFIWPVSSFTLPENCPVFFQTPRKCDPVAPASFMPISVKGAVGNRPSHPPSKELLSDLVHALSIAQSEFFAPNLGTWPDAIDWTAAVIGTHISGAARTISEDLGSEETPFQDWRSAANFVDNYFTETVAYYFGQDALAIKDQAYDDILWVVLGWLETIKFVDTHNKLHYSTTDGRNESEATSVVLDGPESLPLEPYHGTIWIPTFSHRARIFWHLAEQGWDTKLCGGGMIWNPRLLPYKNAITNELFIAASIAMYLHYPGDGVQSRFHNRTDKFNPKDPSADVPRGPRDAKYLKAAVDAYRWLRNSNMTNNQGLVVDGFHISGLLDEKNNNTKCDERDEMVFTYNQGVVLTGQRGLWDATGASSYLADGHKLVQNVINATGYDLKSDNPFEKNIEPGILPKWHGLGRLGVMEEYCDASATCSQDGQTFKGIFFHHLTTFCAPLGEPSSDSGVHFNKHVFETIKRSHQEACEFYTGWLKHNVRAALDTRDTVGRYGQWWTAGLLARDWTGPWPTLKSDGIVEQPNATDYRNYGVPDDSTWRHSPYDETPPIPDPDYYSSDSAGRGQVVLGNRAVDAKDPNDRGRGRTIETQSGGLALLRAYWTIARLS